MSQRIRRTSTLLATHVWHSPLVLNPSVACVLCRPRANAALLTPCFSCPLLTDVFLFGPQPNPSESHAVCLSCSTLSTGFADSFAPVVEAAMPAAVRPPGVGTWVAPTVVQAQGSSGSLQFARALQLRLTLTVPSRTLDQHTALFHFLHFLPTVSSFSCSVYQARYLSIV